MRQRLLAASFAAISALAIPQTARAQSPNDQMLAQSLFDQARTLMDEGRYAEACPKLAESQRLDPGGGTSLNLALCYEKQTKFATAYTQMSAALAQAVKDGRKDREGIARKHMAEILPRIPKISIHVSEEDEGLEVKLDGSVVRRPAWDVPAGVDPGNHTVEAEVPGKPPYRIDVTLAEQEQKVITIPSLTPRKQAATIPAATVNDPSSHPTRANPAYYVALAIGATAMVGGSVAAIGWANANSNDSLSGSKDMLLGVTVVSLAVGALSLGSLAIIPSRLNASIAPQRGGGTLTATLSWP